MYKLLLTVKILFLGRRERKFEEFPTMKGSMKFGKFLNIGSFLRRHGLKVIATKFSRARLPVEGKLRFTFLRKEGRGKSIGRTNSEKLDFKMFVRRSE